MDDYEGSVEDLPPYFLGSIVLIKGDESDAEVVDGQQRLTTLTMLLAALRSLIKSEYAEGLTSFLRQQGNIITGAPTRYRLRLRERDATFFQKYIQDEGGIEELKNLREAMLPESQRNIRDNTLDFIRELQKLPEDKLSALAQFIVNRCFLIVVTVSTTDLDSVYRIFSVLNSRGLDLSYPDILKSGIVSTIPADQREEYATKWEEIESLLEREEFERLFNYLRAIFSTQRPIKGMIEEFEKYVYPRTPGASTPQDFINKTLVPYGRFLHNILNANYRYGQQAKEVQQAKEINEMFKWLNQLDHGYWIPPALYYFKENWHYPNLVLNFLKDLERLVVSFTLRRIPPPRRFDRYYELLKAICDGRDLFTSHSPLQLTTQDRSEVLRILNGDMYPMHYICRYVLLRLDAQLSESIASYEYQAVSIEHVLPQRPSPDSKWVKLFPSKELREQYVHRIGNLVLLSRGKNMKAENYDFELKKDQYFIENGRTSRFALTTQVLCCREWTPAVIEQRQKELVETLVRLWRL